MLMENEKSPYIITICIVNYNSAEFVINTLYCLKHLTKNGYKVIIRDNNSRIEDYEKLEKAVKDFSDVKLYRIENFNHIGSMAHGLAINDLVPQIDTQYGVILDADCTFLHKDWDQILINQLDENYPIIGTEDHDRDLVFGGESFPLMYAVLFDNSVMKKLKIDFTPKKDRGAGNIKYDTGHALRESFWAHGYKGKIISEKNTRVFKEGPFSNIICVEFYLNGYDHIFANHFSRGSTLGKAKYIHTKMKLIYRIPIFGKYLLRKRGLKEKEEWIHICHTIVKKQIKPLSEK